jgi:hypothetical protein
MVKVNMSEDQILNLLGAIIATGIDEKGWVIPNANQVIAPSFINKEKIIKDFSLTITEVKISNRKIIEGIANYDIERLNGDSIAPDSYGLFHSKQEANNYMLERIAIIRKWLTEIEKEFDV